MARGLVVGGARAEGRPSHGVHGNVTVLAAGNDIKSFLLNLQKPAARNSQGEGCPVQIKSLFHEVQMPSNVTRRPLLYFFSSLIGPRHDFIFTMKKHPKYPAGSTCVSRGLFNLVLWESVLKPDLQGV